MDANPALQFLGTVRDFCTLARKRASDPREARIASDLEIELDDRIKEFEASEKPRRKSRALAGARGGGK